jgi:hypothetical protein
VARLIKTLNRPTAVKRANNYERVSV